MSFSKNAFCCLCKHAVKGILHHLGIQVATCCHNCLAKLSQIMELLIICLPWGWENEEAKASHPIYSLVSQEIAPEDIASLCYLYGMELHLAASTWSFYWCCEHESLSESCYSVWYRYTLSCQDFSPSPMPCLVTPTQTIICCVPWKNSM